MRRRQTCKGLLHIIKTRMEPGKPGTQASCEMFCLKYPNPCFKTLLGAHTPILTNPYSFLLLSTKPISISYCIHVGPLEEAHHHLCSVFSQTVVGQLLDNFKLESGRAGEDLLQRYVGDFLRMSYRGGHSDPTHVSSEYKVSSL